MAKGGEAGLDFEKVAAWSLRRSHRLIGNDDFEGGMLCEDLPHA